jgi:PTH1 family peptidyl-tRNA hydrolase
VDPIRIVLGLGNPGSRYRETRHNLGFRVVDGLATAQGTALQKDGFLRRRAWRATVESVNGPVLLAKPRTFMNRSGSAAAALLKDVGCAPGQLLVVYDDADLDFGKIRIREGGGTGGHNGIRSLIDLLGNRDFRRVRLGIRGSGRGEQDLAEYVLSPFDPHELAHAQELVELGVQATEAILNHGLRAGMDEFNRRRVGLAVEPPT